MVRKAKTTETVSEAPVEATATPVEAAVKNTTTEGGEKVRVRKSKKKVAPVETDTTETTEAVQTGCEIVQTGCEIVETLIVENVEDIVPVEVEIVVDTPADVSDKTPEKKKRRLVTKDGLVANIEEFQKELLTILDEKKHRKQIKAFKQLVADVYRLLKIRSGNKKQKDSTNSGFMRPVRASVELEKFLVSMGETLDKPLTRAHLTTLICKYIKEKNLQNPEDRRIIFPDEPLRELFQLKENDEPLTYYNIQKRMQPHVSRIEEALST
jgi:chromatin remodeling complex protein RSC6